MKAIYEVIGFIVFWGVMILAIIFLALWVRERILKWGWAVKTYKYVRFRFRVSRGYKAPKEAVVDVWDMLHNEEYNHPYAKYYKKYAQKMDKVYGLELTVLATKN